MDYFKYLAERNINEAVERGDLDNLKGQGQPLKVKKGDPMTEYLSNSGHLPREALLMKEVEALKAKGLESNSSKIRELELEIAILREKRLR